MHRITLFLVLLFFQNEITAQVKKQVLLLGTFHFENPGADVVKVNSVDVLSDQNQKEIALITERIKDFKPDKIFVEHPYNRQSVLDSLYQNYLNGNNRDDRDEIIQIAFRAAEKLGIKKVYAIDYLDQDTNLPFDSLMNEIQKSEQKELLDSTIEKINQF